MNKIRNIVNNDNIPSPPAVAMKLLDLVNSPDACLSDIQQVVETDPKLSARIIDYTNSPMMGAKRTISSLQQAVVVLGLRSLRLLSLSFSLVEQDDEEQFDFGKFWRNSLVTAIANKRLGGNRGDKADEDFLLGLVFNVGAIGIGCIYPDELMLLEELHPQSREAKEQEIFKGNRYEIGSKLLAKWNFPSHMVAQLENYKSRDSDCKSLYLAELLTELVTASEPDCSQIEFVRHEYQEFLGCGEEEFHDTFNAICEEFREYEALFNVDEGAGSCFSIEELEQRAKEAMFKLSLGLETELQKVSEEKEELESNALTDSLTGLKNRAAYDAELSSALDYHQRKGKGLSLVVIDVDHFKSVNDTLGHAVGDTVLRQVAEKLHENLRKYDTVYRYGGEEFVAILVDCQQNDVEHVAERLRSAIEATEIEELGERKHVTVSVGAFYVAGEDHPQPDVFERADKALYEAKGSGRNRCIIHSTSEISAEQVSA